MGTMWGLHEIRKIARQHSIEAAPPDRVETSVMAQVKVIHDVTACIYKINCRKTASKWSFQTKLDKQQKDKLVESLKVSSGIVERTNELGSFDFKIKLQYKRNVPEAEFPRGRIFAIDSQDQFEVNC